MHKMRRSLLFIAAMLALSTPVLAGTVAFDTLGGLYTNLQDRYVSITDSGAALYQSFTPTSGEINSVQFRLFRPDTSSNGSISAYLFETNPATGLPNAQISSRWDENQLGLIGVLADSSISAGVGVYTLTFDASLIQTGRRYWISLYSTNTNAQWASVLDLNGLEPQEYSGTQNEYLRRADARGPVFRQNTGTNGPFRVQVGMNLNGDPTPEPASLILGGCGIAAIFLLRKSKNSKLGRKGE